MFRFIPYIIKTLWRHRARTILTVSGSAVALFVFCFVGSVQEGMNQLTERQRSKQTLIAFQANKFCPATSHLPHLAVAAIAGLTPEQYVTLTAAGWQDSTRIAAGDPSLWRQILLANRTNVLAALDEYITRLAEWRAALEAQDAVKLEKLLTEAKRIRDAVGS